MGTGQIKSFTALPFFSGAAWQGGPLFPDAALVGCSCRQLAGILEMI